MSQGPNGVARSDHDRDFSKVNGVNGGSSTTQTSGGLSDKSKMVPEKPPNLGMVNGGSTLAKPDRSAMWPYRMNDLPDEIQHITEGFIPISHLLSRLAQKSHNTLQDKISELARKPLPVGAINGKPDLLTGEDDAHNLEKKKFLLNAIQAIHADWVKALVITEWSKKAPQVSKLIDLRWYLRQHIDAYQNAVGELIEQKRALVFASLPGPDLKTALTLLSSGEPDWLPDQGYIEPPPLTAQEQLEWMDNINTLLSMRLSIDDYDKIPYHFRDYRIESARVTFIVKGEFEVDLTIADEDSDKQYWFIDFRFLFAPAPTSLNDITRHHLETIVNNALAQEGLQGCYNTCHELALTSKIAELRRQALELASGRWIDTLNVERLQRSVAVQYWTGRFAGAGPKSPKSWIIVGVNSGRAVGRVAHPRDTSHLSLRWFRDGKEVLDTELPLNGEVVSTEVVLNTIIARHTAYILSTLHAKLLEKPRFAKRQASLRLHLAQEDSLDSWLEVQLTHHDTITARIDPISGQLTLSPVSSTIFRGEYRLNASGKDPTEEGVMALEHIRWQYTKELFNRRCKGHGWLMPNQPIREDEVRKFANTREKYLLLWFKRHDWESKWNVVAILSPAGDRWFLIELAGSPQEPQVKTNVEMPVTSGQPDLDDPFFTDLTVFATGIISHITNIKELKLHKHVRLDDDHDLYRSPRTKFPAINVRLSEILPSLSGNNAKKPWALDFVRIIYRGVETVRMDGGRPGRRLGVIANASLIVTDKSKFALLKGKVDQDVLFNSLSGAFCLTLREEIGRSVMTTLKNKLQAIDRLVDLLDAIRQQHHLVHCESVGLGKVVFTYGDPVGPSQSALPPQSAAAQSRRWKVTLELGDGKATRLTLERGCPHLRVLDFLTRIINHPDVFMSLPYWLALTLPAHRALDKVLAAWAPETLRNRAVVAVIPESVDIMTIRFEILNQQPDKPARVVRLQMRLRTRDSTQWWHIRRSPADNAGDDEQFNRALKKIWDGKADQATGFWRGVGTGALANPDTGIEPCLTAIEEALRTLVGTPAPRPAVVAAVMAGGQPPGAQGQPPQQPQQWQRQQSKQGQAGAAKNKQAVVDLT